MTARISSSVAVCFITIIMPSAFLLLLNDTNPSTAGREPPVRTALGH
jgi:hypothetical protein